MNDLEYVHEALRKVKAPLHIIAAGAGVGASWLRMFRRGCIPDPSYTRVMALADYLRRADPAELTVPARRVGRRRLTA